MPNLEQEPVFTPEQVAQIKAIVRAMIPEIIQAVDSSLQLELQKTDRPDPEAPH
jgi:hypothetical protein